MRVLETRNIVGNEIFPDVNIEQWQVSEDSIELPRGALIENSEGGLVRIVFVAFDRLESILKPLDSVAADQRLYGIYHHHHESNKIIRLNVFFFFFSNWHSFFLAFRLR